MGSSGTAEMRIAFIGSRGVPARYSGVETCVEELGSRLAARGHDVTVYVRRHHDVDGGSAYRGMRLVRISGIATKHLDTISHTFTACLHALSQPYDVVVMSIAGNSPLAFLPRFRGAKVILNVDGTDWRRQKWGLLARTYLRGAEWLSIRLPNAVVTDSPVMHAYYRDTFGANTECIDYGAHMPLVDDTTILDRLELKPQRYLLVVGRLVPENCIHHLVDAYQRLETDLQCVVVGDAPYAKRYIADLKRRGPRVLFTGYVFGEGYRALMQHAYAVVMCSEVGGTHPVLIEAMAAGNCVVVNNTPANLEVIGEAAVQYDGTRGADSLYETLKGLIERPENVERYRGLAQAHAHTRYDWSRVTDQYEALFSRLVGRSASRAREPMGRTAGDA